jgi:hypothetical protein
MKDSIVCFGASVTRQNNSYADFLQNLLEYNIYKEAYGSMHLSDAGICFLNKVIEHNPKYCLIDWFSTAKTDYGNEIIKYLDAIIYKLAAHNIQPIFLLFPISIMLDSRLEMYQNIHKYAKEHNIYIIDIYSKSVEENIDKQSLIKDYVHTTLFGAEYYAKQIAFYMKKFVVESDHKILIPEKNKYSNIKEFTSPISVKDFLEIEVDDELIGIYQTIGPYSDSISIFDSYGNLLNKHDIWDIWSHYERETIKIHIPKPGRYLIKLNNNSVDKTKCKQNFDFSNYNANILNLKKFYFTKNLYIIRYE